MGGVGRDTLLGNEGRDVLIGGKQDDVLQGGLDQDILTGGKGSDRFVIESITDSTVRASDKIADFKRGTDVIVLSAIDANTTIDGDKRFHYIARKGFTATAGELRLNGRSTVMGDVDGDGQADFAIRMEPFELLSKRDFSL